MKKNPLRLTFTISLIFVLSSFLPIIQVLLMYADGALLAIVGNLLFKDDLDNTITTNWIVNFGLSALFLILYFQTTPKSLKITWSVLFSIFSSLFICFWAYDHFGAEDPSPYFLYFLISSLISGIVLNLISILKDKNDIKRASH